MADLVTPPRGTCIAKSEASLFFDTRTVEVARHLAGPTISLCGLASASKNERLSRHTESRKCICIESAALPKYLASLTEH